MATTHFRRFPAIADFSPSEDRTTLLRRIEEFLRNHEQVSEFEFDDSVDALDRISVMFVIQLGFSADECYDEDPTEKTIAERENQLADLVARQFEVLSIAILEDAGVHLDSRDE